MKIKRTQIPLLPNFAMTDYSAQGKTRPANVVDIVNCQDFHGVYTCLSRGTSLKGTVILRDFSDDKLNNELDGALRQEYRDLNYLDIVMTLRYDGLLPAGILHPTRRPTVVAYRAWKVTNEEAAWHPAIAHDRELDNVLLTVPEMAIETIKGSAKRKAAEEARTSSHPPKKKPRRTFRLNSLYVIPTGPTWDGSDYSCAYDIWTTILHWLWYCDSDRWSRVLSQYSGSLQVFVEATEAQKEQPLGVNLSLVRDIWRSKIRELHPAEFSGIRGTDLVSLACHLLGLDQTFPSVTVQCHKCGSCSTTPHSSDHVLACVNILNDELSISNFVHHRAKALGYCTYCGGNVHIEHPIDDLVCFETVESPGISLDTSFMIGKHGHYNLVGVIYYSDFHFVCRVITSNQKVFGRPLCLKAS
jgi:hypothetical protein